MNALVTLAIGNRGQSIARLTEPVLRRYARRCSCEFVCIDTPKVGQDPKFEKLQIYDLLETYERIVYFDADVLIMPSCPDLCRLVPSGIFGAYFDSGGGNGDAEEGFPDLRTEEIESYQRLCGDIGWKTTYFNSGVMVLSRTHREIFSYQQGVRRSFRFVDQTLLNYRLQKSSLPWMDLGSRFNHFAAFNRSERLYRSRFESYVIHYAGFNEFYPDRSLSDQIVNDVAIAYPSL